jgi:hypothetical protein
MPEMPQDRLALDRSPSSRRIDQDGHMHVTDVRISKAAVNGYYGREIPDGDRLGLQPDRIYQLLRDPEELAKAAATFDGKPLLNLHKPQAAADHDHDLTVGGVHNVRWEAPYLVAGSFDVWDAASIGGIQDDSQREVSSSYRYRADMTPGTYEGVRFDGVMRDLIANHVALVESGRAGKDVMVGDSNPFPKTPTTNRRTTPWRSNSLARARSPWAR